jgi:hypothetical protein
MDAVIIILAVGAICIASFFVGAWVGSRKGEVIVAPEIDPLKPIRAHKERKKQKAEKDAWDTIMSNIDNYDGTSNGQIDIPRR